MKRLRYVVKHYEDSQAGVEKTTNEIFISVA